MRFTRLFSVTAMVAAVTLLASCGESSSPATSATTDPSFALGPRAYTLTPGTVGWTKLPTDPIPTDVRTVLVAGNIALASYPLFGTPVYTGTSPAGNWLDMNLAPNFSRNPLGWLVSFKLKASAAALPIGTYTVTIPVTVPAATNNPTNLVVTFSNCGNCLFVGDVRASSFTALSPRYDRNTFSGAGNYPYEDWRVFVEPGATVYVQVIGSTYVVCAETGALGTMSDPFLRIFDGTTSIGANDDTCGYQSQVAITNPTGVRKEYLARPGPLADASGDNPPTYVVFGTYTIRVSAVPFGGGGGPGLMAPPSAEQLRMKQRALGGH